MDCLGIIARKQQLQPEHVYSVELNSTARKIADKVNPASETFPGLDHSHLPNDVSKITEDHIKSISPINMLACGAPCEDFSRLRLLPPRHKNDKSYAKGDNPRPGLDGPKGTVLRTCIKILGWALKHNPDLKYFFENVPFEDMHDHWAEVEQALGPAFIVDALDFSNTRRQRAYWTNIQLPTDFAKHPKPLNPDECMGAGRKVYHNEHIHASMSHFGNGQQKWCAMGFWALPNGPTWQVGHSPQGHEGCMGIGLAKVQFSNLVSCKK